MSYVNDDALVETDWLATRLASPDVRVLDASYYLPGEGRDTAADFRVGHIPGAVFFDIDAVADADNPLPHMLPGAEQFAHQVGALGIANDQHVVVYDTAGLFSAARVWWMFRVFGHDRVAVLSGGMPKWLAEGRPTEGGDGAPAAAEFAARFRPELARSIEDMRANLESGAAQVLDARGAGRFAGTEPELRPGLRSGHIPGSRNLPYPELVDPATKAVLDAPALGERFAAAGIELGRPVITTCGSGVTACALAFGLHLLGHGEVAVYDGSWTEWGGRDDTPVET
jgi:thiosulfate/3-mercaptopyruvate sulfurtransferase